MNSQKLSRENERMQRILIAEDSDSLLKATTRMLEIAGYETRQASNGREADEKIISDVFDCILLDVMMPYKNGIDILTDMRKRGDTTPVILLTALDDTSDKVAGLEAGANDYLTKPFKREELLARLKRLLNGDSVAARLATIGNVSIDREKMTISTDRSSFSIDPKEMKLLLTLAKRTGKPTPSELLAEHIWGGLGTAESVRLYVSYVDKKLKLLSASVRISEVSDGYLLVGGETDDGNHAEAL